MATSIQYPISSSVRTKGLSTAATHGTALSYLHGNVACGYHQLSQLPHQLGRHCANTSQHTNAKPAGRNRRTHARVRWKYAYGRVRLHSTSHPWSNTASEGR